MTTEAVAYKAFDLTLYVVNTSNTLLDADPGSPVLTVLNADTAEVVIGPTTDWTHVMTGIYRYTVAGGLPAGHYVATWTADVLGAAMDPQIEDMFITAPVSTASVAVATSDLELTRGDTRTWAFTIERDGAPVDLTGSTVRFTAKRSYADADADAVIAKSTDDDVQIFDAAAGVAWVIVNPTDTSALEAPLSLVWDLEIDAAGVISTPLQGTLEIAPDVRAGMSGVTGSPLLTVAQLREHLTTSLEDSALQRLLDDAKDQIIDWAGDDATATEILSTGSSKLVLSRAAQSITSIVERRGVTDTTLAADDYQLYPGGYVIERLSGGTNSSPVWRGRVTVIHVPVSDVARRRMAQLDLVKLAIASEPALASRTIGAYSESFRGDADPATQRAAILSRLLSAPRMLVVGG